MGAQLAGADLRADLSNLVHLVNCHGNSVTLDLYYDYGIEILFPGLWSLFPLEDEVEEEQMDDPE